jgi:hypothetical protein
MKSHPPKAFRTRFQGSEGLYEIAYNPQYGDDGLLEAEITGISMQWVVELSEQDSDGWRLAGITHGSQAIWGDCYWFELILLDRPIEIRYWGNGVVWRTDQSIRK